MCVYIYVFIYMYAIINRQISHNYLLTASSRCSMSMTNRRCDNEQALVSL